MTHKFSSNEHEKNSHKCRGFFRSSKLNACQFYFEVLKDSKFWKIIIYPRSESLNKAYDITSGKSLRKWSSNSTDIADLNEIL